MSPYVSYVSGGKLPEGAEELKPRSDGMYEIVVDEIYYRLTSLQDLEEDEPAKLYGLSSDTTLRTYLKAHDNIY
ncbi:hypothetical protein EG327_003607 [Venturia inaequalis]|uniref:Uncharacterized protein n=1 Tax=Venturia inaequalis TaxID=5025 RepID=A0A8H3VHM4_VENIN|nr:hypothetical protein EG327_003607 [Venturia inaequalis]